MGYRGQEGRLLVMILRALRPVLLSMMPEGWGDLEQGEGTRISRRECSREQGLSCHSFL